MNLEQTKGIFQAAQQEKRAIAAYDTVSYHYMDWAAEAASQFGAPLIFMFYPNFREIVSFEEFIGWKKILEKKYSIPLIAHLDHSKSFEEIKEAIAAGFDSVMIDMSDRPFEENVLLTKQTVKYAHKAGVAAEGELGRVGSGSNAQDFQDSSLYTDPDQAREFVKQTGVDLLAVAIGNSHGVYVKTPHLDIERLKLLAAQAEIPLVLHGTSLIPENQVAQAVQNGICKVNLATEMYLAAMDALTKAVEEGQQKTGGPFFAQKAVKPAMMQYFTNKIKLLGNY